MRPLPPPEHADLPIDPARIEQWKNYQRDGEALPCFPAGTLVHVPGGLARIEDLGIGDSVLSWNERTRKPDVRVVVQIHCNWTDEMVLISTNQGDVRATRGHRFSYRTATCTTPAEVIMYRAKAGDVFSIPIGKKEFLSGRVLLDIETQCVAPGRLRTDSPLIFFAGAMLVEVHGSPVPEPAVADERVLIPSIFVVVSALTSGRWRVVGHRPVDPMFVDFPPALTLVGSAPHLSWGEIVVPIAMEYSEMEALDISPTLEMSRVDQIALFALGREKDIDRKRVRNLDILRLDGSDIRFHPRREELFKLAGLPPQPTYYHEALKRGFDLRRFYDADPRVPFQVCPYCWARRTPEDICWACREDTSRDAAIQTTQQELDTMDRKICPSCKTSIPEDAIICATCRARQPDG